MDQLVAVAMFVTRPVVVCILLWTLYEPYIELRKVNEAVKIGERRRLIRQAFAAGYRYRMTEEQERSKQT